MQECAFHLEAAEGSLHARDEQPGIPSLSRCAEFSTQFAPDNVKVSPWFVPTPLRWKASTKVYAY